MERRRKLVNFFGCLCVAFVFAGCVEGKDGGITFWNLLSLTVAFLLGIASNWLNKSIKLIPPADEQEEKTEEKEGEK